MNAWLHSQKKIRIEFVLDFSSFVFVNVFKFKYKYFSNIPTSNCYFLSKWFYSILIKLWNILAHFSQLIFNIYWMWSSQRGINDERGTDRNWIFKFSRTFYQLSSTPHSRTIRDQINELIRYFFYSSLVFYENIFLGFIRKDSTVGITIKYVEK